MPVSSSFDVFDQLVNRGKDYDWILGLVAFAVFEERRIDWMKHFETQNGEPPTDDQVRHWYEQQTDGDLLRAEGEAENALRGFGARVTNVVFEEERISIENDVIVSEVRSLNKPWAAFGIGMAANLLSAFVFAAALVLLVIYAKSDTAPQTLSNLFVQAEKGAVQHGQETNK